MIEFECSYCQAAMAAPDSRAGEVERCPSCGMTAVVPFMPEAPDQGSEESEQQVCTWWASNKRVLIVTSSVVAVMLLAMILIVVLAGGPDGLFPARSEVAALLEKHGYFPNQTEGVEEVFRGRKLRTFSYVRDARAGREHFARIRVWCPVDDSSRVVGVSSVWPGEVILDAPSAEDNPVGYLNSAFDKAGLSFHGSRVRLLVEELSSIKYTWWDIEESRKENKGKGARLDREKAGFSMELLQKRDGETTDGKPRYTTLMFLKDKTW